MPTNLIIGEFEQIVLLSLLHLRDAPYALPLRDHLNGVVKREVSRSALYRTLDRLEEKGFLEWDLEHDRPARGGHPRRRFRVTAEGLSTLKASRSRLTGLWTGLEEILG